jgi:hypothetical protein
MTPCKRCGQDKMKKTPSFKEKTKKYENIKTDFDKMVTGIIGEHPIIRYTMMENSLRRELGHIVQAALITKTGNKMAGYTTLERIVGVSRTQARRMLHVELTGDLLLRTIVQTFDVLDISFKDAFTEGIALKVRKAGKK